MGHVLDITNFDSIKALLNSCDRVLAEKLDS